MKAGEGGDTCSDFTTLVLGLLVTDGLSDQLIRTNGLLCYLPVGQAGCRFEWGLSGDTGSYARHDSTGGISGTLNKLVEGGVFGGKQGFYHPQIFK